MRDWVYTKAWIKGGPGITWGYPESHHIGKINLHPSNPDIAWVAVLGHLYSPNKERGIYKTTDSGKTWKQTLFVDDNTGAVDMDINPKNPNELYAAMWYRTRRAWNFEEGGKTIGIYKSIDGGDTWKLVSGAGSGFPLGDGLGRVGIAVFGGNPNIVYATLDNQGRRPDTAKKKVDTNYVLKDFKALTKESFEKLDNNKLPRVPVHDIVIQERENDLVVGTHGRSVYIARLKDIHKVYERSVGK